MLFCRILENVAIYALKYKAVKGGGWGGGVEAGLTAVEDLTVFLKASLREDTQ